VDWHIGLTNQILPRSKNSAHIQYFGQERVVIVHDRHKLKEFERLLKSEQCLLN